MKFQTLPFKSVEDFDYKSIADDINNDNPDIIWVSLGAPKQEYFMFNLLPCLNRGIMFGFGATFNFNAGKISKEKRATDWMRSLMLEWLYRAFERPEKNVPRYWSSLRLFLVLIYNERNTIK